MPARRNYGIPTTLTPTTEPCVTNCTQVRTKLPVTYATKRPKSARNMQLSIYRDETQ
jgi:hypothetical protein